MKRILFAALTLLSCISLSAQREIRTDLVFKVKTDFDFTEEWQYLSSDLYLFNTDQFGLLINELITDKRDHRKSDKLLEMLTITAELKDMKFFDNQQIVYPIYNFQIDHDNNKDYSTRISNYREVVRLIDNLPLASTNETVEAEIRARAVTNHQRIEVFSLVSNQLITISKLLNPTEAVLTLVGEFGNFLQSAASPPDNAKKRNYEFASTIRLYEGENFNQRLYSIRVYAFLPPDKQVRFDGRELTRYLEGNPNPYIDRKTLEGMNRFRDYPFLIVVNYKSRYQMPVVVGDEVNAEMIRKREEQVSKDYRMELINEAAYSQEREFIEYLKEFAQLKKAVENYTLAFEAGSTSDMPKNLFAVVQNYYELLHVFQSREREFGQSSVYLNVFREKYQAILRNAELYLDKDFYLKRSRAMVHSLLELDKIRISSLDSLAREMYMESLYAVKLPGLEFLGTSVLGQEIIRKAGALEEVHYRELFQQPCMALRQAEATDVNLGQRNDLLQRVNRGYCISCKEKVNAEVKAFDNRYRQQKLRQMLVALDHQKLQADDRMFSFLQRKECIGRNLASFSEDRPAYLDLLVDRFEETNKDLEELHAVLASSDQLDRSSIDAVKNYGEQMETLVKNITQGYGYICEKMEELCGCE